MTIRVAIRFLLSSFLSLLACAATWAIQGSETGIPNKVADLQFVVALSRHGVRSPTGRPDDRYSAAPWPQWDVPSAYLTSQGYQLMKLFGAWDRVKFSGQGLFASSCCPAAAQVTILADSDQRTRETGKALAEGMFPGCFIDVHAQAQGTADPLFNLVSGLRPGDAALVTAAVAGRIGGDPNQLTEAYRPQLAALDRVLAGCGHAPPSNKLRTSIFDIPAGLSPGTGGDPTALTGPVIASSEFTENLLLEYTTGMSDANIGWGCVDSAKLRGLMQLATASWDYGYRTPTIARIYASNLLYRIERSMEQNVTGKPAAGALSKPDDRLLIIVGHDSNIVTVAGALGINWVIDGRVDDTPPGGVLLFEVWRPRDGGKPFVRLEYTAQTLEQMRYAQPLTSANPPAAAPIFMPGCSRHDLSCTWDGFSAALLNATDPAYVSTLP